MTWFRPNNLPPLLKMDSKTSFTVVLARDANMTDVVKTYPDIVSHGSGNVVVYNIPMSDIEPGRQFFMAVKVKKPFIDPC